jgi:GH18 family chitinase
MCLSKGTPPFPAPIANAICGPQKPGTKEPDDMIPEEWAQLNPCPLNACCNLWGQCGITPEFCEMEDSDSGNPGTGLCVDNCGTSIVNDDIPPDSFSKVGYFLASNTKRDCLVMDAYSIRTADYTHIQFAFGDISDDFAVSITEHDQEQFKYFKELSTVKKVISFGGWDFSTFPETYSIFRNAVKEENRGTFAKNVVDFVNDNDLDGVDFDWEYPGAPDIPGIPAGDEDDGKRYLEFLKEVRSQLPDEKSLSIAAPASFWYLQAFPIDEIAEVVSYIVYMTYDLRGQWDYDTNDPPDGCPAGHCLRSHINSTETQYALAMITKAQVQTKKLMVGVSSYGRAYEMTDSGCTGPECTYTGNGASPGRCTDTSGYLANAEILEIQKENGSVDSHYDADSDSDIVVYNETQWVAFMTDETRNRRIDDYEGKHMGGSVEWSIDLQTFIPGIEPGPGIFLPIPDDMDIDDFCSEPDWDSVSEDDASAKRNISAYFDYFFDEVRGGSEGTLFLATFVIYRAFYISILTA